MTRTRGLVAMGGAMGLLYENKMGFRHDIEYGAPVSLGWEFAAPSTKARSSQRRIIGGYATRYGKPHVYKGNFDLFSAGVFAKTLLSARTVRFLEDHSEAKCLAATGGAGLHLWSDEVGLAFKCELPNTVAGERVFADVKSYRKNSMSIAYRDVEFDERKFAGETVRVINAASLIEISLVDAGAVKHAYAEALPSDDDLEQPFERSKASADSDGTFMRMRELMQRLTHQFENK